MIESDLLTVGIPVHNNREGLEAAISCLAKQDVKMRVLVADNASVDITEKEINQLKINYPSIHYHRHEENIGAAKNFEYLLRAANTKYFAWLAADDRVTPSFFRTCIEKLENDQSLEAVTMWSEASSSGSRSSDGATEFLEADAFSRVLRYLKSFPDKNMRFYSTYRTKTLNDIYDSQLEYYAGDWGLFCSVLLEGRSAVLHDAGEAYIKAPGGISEKSDSLLSAPHLLQNYIYPTQVFNKTIPRDVRRARDIKFELTRIRKTIRRWHHYQIKVKIRQKLLQL